MRPEIPIETFDPEGRGLLTTWLACSRFLPYMYSSLTVHCRARSRRPIAKSDRRHGASAFGGESTVSARKLEFLLPHMTL